MSGKVSGLSDWTDMNPSGIIACSMQFYATEAAVRWLLIFSGRDTHKRRRALRRTCLRFLGVSLLILLRASELAFARAEWYRGLDLEHAVELASLVVAARVVDISELKVAIGGKGERSIQQFEFEPRQVLKGVFSRPRLTLTSDDLGTHRFVDLAQIDRGEICLLILGRSSEGYTVLDQFPSLDHALPRLQDSNDPLLDAVRVLLAVNASRERAKKVTLLLGGLRTHDGPAAIPLLSALTRRALIAAQTPGAVEVVTKHLSNSSPAVREQAAITLHEVLDADYLDQLNVRRPALSALLNSLTKSDANLGARVAAIDALGSAGMTARDNPSVIHELQLDQPGLTFAEQSSRLQAAGQLEVGSQRTAVTDFVSRLPFDAPSELEYSAEWTLIRLDPYEALKQLSTRIKAKLASGLGVSTEIRLFGKLPRNLGVPALLDFSKLPLERNERMAFAAASCELPDPELVPALRAMLDLREPEIRWHAVEALKKIDTDEAAKALRPLLREEPDLLRKLEIAEFLGRHGLRDGYPYAIEHVAEPRLREQAVAALAAIREPNAGPELKHVLETSNDLAWKSAAIRVLGRLGEVEFGSQFLEIARNLKDPLAPSALIALGDLGEAKALELVREGMTSRSTEVLVASLRAAGRLLALPDIQADDIHDQLASVLADFDAPQEAREVAFNSLVTLKDPRLDTALIAAVGDASLEGSELLKRIEKLLRERKIKIPSV